MINQIKCLCNVRHSTRICLSIDYIYDILKTREAMRNWKIKSQFKWNIVQFTIYNLVSSGKNWNRLRHDARTENESLRKNWQNKKKKKKLNTNNTRNNHNSTHQNSSNHQQNNHRRPNRKKSKSRTTTTTTTTTTMKPSIEMINNDEWSNRTCLIGDVCGHKQMGYCYRPHEPNYFDLADIDTENFYDLLLTSCPHFFDEEGMIHLH